MVCAQYLLSGVDWDPDLLGFWLGDIAPGGYAWVFPKGEGLANVGLGVQADLVDAPALVFLDRFVESEAPLRSSSPVTLIAGNVPVANPCYPAVTDGLLLVGDAARHVDPLTGGGIMNSMVGGSIAADVAAAALRAGNVTVTYLEEYQTRIAESFGSRLAKSARLRKRFPPDQRIDRRFVRLFAVATGAK
jgi:digeranylgeranylglycerophospholipid reductase